MKSAFVRIYVLASYLALGFVSASFACSQTAHSAITPEWTTAPNRWRLDPTDLSSEGDTVTAAVRAARAPYLMRRLRMLPSSSNGMIVDFDFGKPDVSPPTNDERNMVWIVGTFTSHHVYDAGDTAQFLYTEANFEVNTVIYQPLTSSLVAGSTVDIVLYGGTAKTKDNVVHSFYLAPSKYALEPNHRYILALWKEPYGLFAVHRQWDVTNGVAQVSSRIDEEHVRTGTSQLVGLPLADGIDFIHKALSNQ